MPELTQFLTDNRVLFRIVHLLALALGFGGVILSDIFLFKFVRASKLTAREANILQTFSKVIWIGILLFIISGIALSIPRLGTLLQSSKFLVKIIATAVLTVNGILLGLLISPKLTQLFKANITGKLKSLRKFSFALGAVSIVSWSTAFILGGLRSLEIAFIPLLTIYIFTTIFAIFISQIVESQISKSL